MARPSKNNAEYFSHDADMRNDVKIKALRRRFSHKGYAVWCFILETLTDTDYFEIDFNEVSQELLAADYDITVEELREIVQYCELIGLLQITPENKVFSAAHQRRFSGLINKRERDRERLQTLINKRKQTETEVIAAKTSENEDYRSDNSHSKVKESKENIELWRCYFPQRTFYRFITNWPSKKIQGYDQLPKKGKLLVITKSLKDVACLYSMNITAIAPCSENLFIPESILNNLKKRFEYIVVFYDNDRPGLFNMAKIRKEHPELTFTYIPKKYNSKDISDFYKDKGRKETLKLIKQFILWLKNRQ